MLGNIGFILNQVVSLAISKGFYLVASAFEKVFLVTKNCSYTREITNDSIVNNFHLIIFLHSIRNLLPFIDSSFENRLLILEDYTFISTDLFGIKKQIVQFGTNNIAIDINDKVYIISGHKKNQPNVVSIQLVWCSWSY